MSAEVIRKQIHGYIDKADNRFLNLVHAMMVADLEESKFELPEETIQILEERLEDFKKNPEVGSSMEDVFNRLRDKR